MDIIEMAPKAVILQYTPTCNGIGDFFRAIENMYYYCKLLGIELYLNITNPIGAYFDYKKYPGDITRAPLFNTFTGGTSMFNKFIEKLPSMIEPVVIIQTNKIHKHKYLVFPPVITPKKEIQNICQELMKKNGLINNSFIALHYRVGDKCWNINYCKTDDRGGGIKYTEHERIQKLLVSNKARLPIVIFSDSYEKKLALAKKYGFKFINIKPVHTSVGSMFKDDKSAVLNTVLEFLTISNARTVYCMTRSGFPEWAARYGKKKYINLWV